MDLFKRKPTGIGGKMAKGKGHKSGTFSLFNFRKVQIHIYNLNASKKTYITLSLILSYLCVIFYAGIIIMIKNITYSALMSAFPKFTNGPFKN